MRGLEWLRNCSCAVLVSERFCMMEEVQIPFRCLGQALAFYNNCNPARAKSVNFFEPERQFSSLYERTGLEPADIWASVALAIHLTLSRCRNPLHRKFWAMRNVGDSTGHWAVEDIAAKVHMAKERVGRIINELNDDLELELKRRELMPWSNEK